MKRDFGKSIVLIFSVMLTLLLSACQNPFLVDATKLYKASFETNCDTKIDSYRTSKIESEPKVTKTDYVFDGWYTNKSCNGDPITFPYELSEDTTFYAKWGAMYCTVKFVTNCEIELGETKLPRDSKLIEGQIPKLTRENYDFKGWYTNPSFEGEPIAFPYELTENVTLYAKWESIYCTIIYYEGETELASKTVLKGSKLTDEQITKHLSEFEIELEKTRYVFDAWYTSKDFSESSIVLPFEVESDIKLYARWIDEHNILTFTSNADITGNNGYADGVLTIASNYEKVIFKDFQSTNLSIELSNPNIKVVLDNFSFSSSKGSLIDSSSDFLIEYKGDNILSSSASSAVPLIKGSGRIEIKGNDKSKLELQPNTVTDSTDGSIGVKANEVIISSGNFVINGSDGTNYSNDNKTGNRGRNGSSGIEATETIIRNNAIVTIEAGNGGDGCQGITGVDGYSPPKNDSPQTYRAPSGENGYDGKIGGMGGIGGSAIIGNLILESGKVALSGGKGGKGGKGGTGGNGGKGSFNNAAAPGGGHGGNGGTGGQGGTGGNGGDAISGTFTYQCDSITLIGGNRGEGGDGGDGGKRGEAGGRGNFVWCGDSGNPGNPGSPGKPGNPGHDGVEHR